MVRREHACVLGDVLAAIHRRDREPFRAESLTRIASHANVAFGQLMEYLKQLWRLGLLAPESDLHLTPRGEGFLLCYRQWNRVLAEYGLQEAGEDQRILAPGPTLVPRTPTQAGTYRPARTRTPDPIPLAPSPLRLGSDAA